MKRIEYDLHIHSSASDGLLSPEEIFNAALNKGLRGISITDHDTISSLEKCIKISENYDFDFIPGIELSTNYNGTEVHILGYLIDIRNEDFLSFLKHLQDSRLDRAEKMVNIICSLGYHISLKEVLNIAGNNIHSVGRPHIGRLLVEKGYFKDTIQVFDELLDYGKPAYIGHYKINVEDAINKIKAVNGIPVLAHPMITSGVESGNKFENFIKDMMNFGIDGIEVFHTLHTKTQECYLLDIAKKNNLVITGGSDCHGILGEGGYSIGINGVTSNDVLMLKQLKESRYAKW